MISTPIHFHTRQITTALENGCHVLCEKPLCGDADDIVPLIEARTKPENMWESVTSGHTRKRSSTSSRIFSRECTVPPFLCVTNKLRRAVDAVKKNEVKPCCGIEAAAVHTRCITEAQKSGVTDFANEDIVIRENSAGLYLRGLYEKIIEEYENTGV